MAKIRVCKAIIFFIILGIMGCATQASTPVTSLPLKPLATITPSSSRLLDPRIETFIAEMVLKHNLSQDYLHNIFANVNLDQDWRLVVPSAGPMTWSKYRQIVLNPELVQRGVTFMRENKAALQRAELTYRVDKELIAAIIGIETHFGKNQGRFNEVERLSYLAFNPHRRSNFYRHELEIFLLLAKKMNLNVLRIYGSSSGAIGLVQFMPSSYRKYAVDFDGDGIIDLFNSPSDAIGSVGHYFFLNHWHHLEPAAIRVASNDGFYSFYLNGEHSREYWRTYHNFNVIKLYNKSNWYATAVTLLAEKLHSYSKD